MEFGLSEEQRGLAATIRTLLARRADSAAVRSATESGPGYDVGLWQTLCGQIGAAALAIPEKYDGAGFTLFETGIVMDELGRSLAPSPLLASVIAAEALLASEDEAARERLLPRIAAGSVATLAWQGPSTAAPGDEPVRAQADRLTGSVCHVLLGDASDVLLVAAETATGQALFEVAPSAVAWTSTPAMDTTLRLAVATFDDTPGVRLTGDAGAALRRAHLAGTAGVAALQLGCARRALEMTVDYAKTRVQFGRPIGSFQALKHRMADMLVQVETTRSVVWAAMYAVATGAPDAEELVHVAASYAGEALHDLAAETIQLHGGIAITWEHDAQMLFKRAHALGQLFGQPHQHRALLAL
ncbi:Butyryl-CoA dehydrogenase [Alloactinosynnema sp. L-07]|uniref:acyl-CoA dehydrogenase family protein n=1 Tax=Alloactinosynnema sp. L-07 TaxID=1653480 RepID=UPI00065EFF2D|nr:acyl-CoA dehydrogenase family protein [Alloactinosynnema sp. L-07]CRK57778.1 Butyryl-CoA dehydrogenase [Alloactinosynnema sp. L-07]